MVDIAIGVLLIVIPALALIAYVTRHENEAVDLLEETVEIITKKVTAKSKSWSRNHIIPRFYLRYFCDSGGEVWTYGRQDVPIRQRPKNTAVEKGVYSQQYENQLKRSEGTAATLWEDLLQGKVPTGKKREVFSRFLADMRVRSRIPLVESLVDYISLETYQVSFDFTLGFQKEFHGMKWRVFKSEDLPFITSDSPVVIGYTKKLKTVFFPLSPTRLLVLTNYGKEGNMISLSRRNVRAVNRILARQTIKYLYTNQCNSGIQKLYDRYIKSRGTRFHVMQGSLYRNERGLLRLFWGCLN